MPPRRPNVLVIISPSQGKEKRVGEILTSVTDKVKEDEPDTLNYYVYRSLADGEGNVHYVVGMNLRDPSALEKRRELQHHQDIARIIKDEDLLRQPLQYLKLEEFGGFDK